MTYNIRLPDELGRELRDRCRTLHLSKAKLARKAGRVREVVDRLTSGQDATLPSLFAVLAELVLVMRAERVGPPTAAEVARHVVEDDDVA